MNSSGRPVAWLLILWLITAFALGMSGRLAALRPPMPQLVILLLTLASLSAALWVPRFRSWADQVSIRVLVALHLTRFVGAYFLVLSHEGRLPPEFAKPAGIGDIAVAMLASVLLATVIPSTPSRRRFYLAWNILGLIDILLVVFLAARTGLANPHSMQPLLHLPLSLLPTFLVPIIITSHILLFRRLCMRPAQISAIAPSSL